LLITVLPRLILAAVPFLRAPLPSFIPLLSLKYLTAVDNTAYPVVGVVAAV
jgi:hypothetical protein